MWFEIRDFDKAVIKLLPRGISLCFLFDISDNFDRVASLSVFQPYDNDNESHSATYAKINDMTVNDHVVDLCV